MTTRVELNTDLLQEARELGGHTSMADAVREALDEYIRRMKRRKLAGMIGQVEWDPAYDYKAERRSR